jgi:YfiH family protein
VIAYTTTRHGGVSASEFSSLNLGEHVGDKADNVAKNRRLLPYAERIAWLNQVHSNRVVLANKDELLNADAAISRTPDLFCGVMTADCVPILLCNKQGTEVAAIHAGWQGLRDNIIANTINAMGTKARELLAWIGPCIHQQHYQVGEEVACHFWHYPNACTAFDAEAKCYLDVVAVAVAQLRKVGVGFVRSSELCTYEHNQRFFSHRYSQHHQLNTCGRMVSVIGLI